MSRSTRSLGLHLLTAIIVLATLLCSPESHANPWDDTDQEAPAEEPADPPAEADPPIPPAKPVGLPPLNVTSSAPAGFLYMESYDATARIGMSILIGLLGYILPGMFFFQTLLNSDVDAGVAAASLLFVGGLLALPGLLAIWAKAVYVGGILVPWYAQASAWMAAAICTGFLWFIALFARMTGART